MATKNDRGAFTLRRDDWKNLERIQEHLKNEGNEATQSAAVRYALFRVAMGLGPPKKLEERASAAE